MNTINFFLKNQYINKQNGDEKKGNLKDCKLDLPRHN